jgi:subtilisin family serine protease
MNFSPRFSWLLALSAFAISVPNTTLAQRSHGNVPDELLVGVAPVDLSTDAPAADRSIGAVLGSNPDLGVMRVRVARGFTLAQAAARLRARKDVTYVEPNGIYRATATPNDPSFSSQYAPKKVQADLAWSIWTPKAQVNIAVVDTGVDYNHPDLTNKILRVNGAVVGYNAIGSNARSGNTTDAIDDQGHGTHCAGIAAAQVNNGIGVAGIAGWSGGTTSDVSTKIIPVKVLASDGSGTDATGAQGITWAANNGAKVISLSVGGGGSTTLSNAVAYAWSKGCVLVAAAGNESTSGYSYPAAYPNVISVAATDSSDTLASYSNYGSWVKVAAPGSAIYSTLPTVSTGSGFGTNYGSLSGTSMATPLVAGEAALILAHNPALTNSQVNSFITAYVDPYTPYSGRTIASGAGRVNVYRALQAAGGSVIVPAVPTGLKAVAGNAQVTLTWNASPGATTYRVKKLDPADGLYHWISTPTGTTYTDTRVVNGSSYSYAIAAANSAGYSANSAPVSATPTAAVVQQMLANPGFESGATASWTATPDVITNSAERTPRSGSWYAWLCDYGTATSDSLYQTVTIPSTATNATLTFYLKVDSDETTTTTAYDRLSVQILNSAGTVLSTLATYSNLNKGASYTLRSFDLTAYRGQTIRIRLSASEDGAFQTSFTADDFALNVK